MNEPTNLRTRCQNYTENNPQIDQNGTKSGPGAVLETIPRQQKTKKHLEISLWFSNMTPKSNLENVKIDLSCTLQSPRASCRNARKFHPPRRETQTKNNLALISVEYCCHSKNNKTIRLVHSKTPTIHAIRLVSSNPPKRNTNETQLGINHCRMLLPLKE